MGTQLIAKRAGTCPKCSKAWNVSESIYWDGKQKNQAGFSVTCTDQKCFESQNGTITPKSSSGFGNTTYPSRYQREQLDVTAKLPVGYESNKEIDSAAAVVLRVITKADKIASDMYPNLKHDTNTYGQIRSKITDQILSVHNHTED
jgi:hypothetical protein